MTTSDEEVNTKSTEQPLEPHRELHRTSIPQIILTEAPPDEQPQAHEFSLGKNSATTLTLSPGQSSHKKTTKTENSSVPLPLTKDLLRRKNKLERLLHRQEKDKNKAPNPLGISYPEDSPIDERVTAGLGISTFNQKEGLRHRQSYHSESDTKDQNNSSIKQQHSWHHNRQKSFTTNLTDSTNQKSKNADTSVTGTSNRNNKTSANNDNTNERHRYIDQYHSNRYYRQLQKEKLLKNSQKSKYYLLELVFNAAKRVVHSRVSESEDVANAENFDLFRGIHNNTPVQFNKTADNSPFYSSPNYNRNNNRISWLSASTTNTNNEGESYSLNVFTKDKIPSTPQMDTSPNAFYNQPSPDQLLPSNPLQGSTLRIFAPNSLIRNRIWLLIRSRYTETFTLCLMVLHWFLLACTPIASNEQKSIFGGHWIHFPIMFIQIIYSLEAICKIIAYGLFFPPAYSKFKRIRSWASVSEDKQHLKDDIPLTENSSPFSFSRQSELSPKNTHRAYLNSFANVLDAISIVSYWTDVVLMTYGYPYLSLFKALGALRPIRLLSLLPGTAVILKSLELSWDILLAVSGLSLFFLLLFALLVMLVEPAKFCTGYMNGTTLIGPYNVQSDNYDYAGQFGSICSSGQICIEDPANNPQDGFVNYDNIFFSFLSVYTFVSLELWTDLMYQTQYADSTVAALYYCLGVYIISFILSFLLLAVITSAFARVRALNSVSAFTAKRRGHLILRDNEEANTEEDSETTWMFGHRPDEHRKGVSTAKLRWFIIQIVRSRSFFYFGGFLVLFDLIFMCLRSYSASDERLDMVDNAETAFTFIFAIEIVIRMAGVSNWINFWSSKRNALDLFIVIATCVIQLPMIQDSSVYKYLTIFQICRLYRLFLCVPRVRRLVTSALGTGESVLNVMIFLVLGTALCSTMFMQLFGGDYSDIADLTDPSNRFDNFWQSFVSLIVVYTTETWTDILYNAMSSQAGKGSIYAATSLSVYYLFGRYIMSGLYIAVVLENFELSDDYIRHYQIKDYIDRHRFKDSGKTENILMKLFRPLYHWENKKSLQVSKLPANLTAPLSNADITELLADISKAKRKVDSESANPFFLEKKIRAILSKIQARIPFFKKKDDIKSVPTNTFVLDYEDVPEDYEIIAAEENREATKEEVAVARSLLIFSDRSRIRYFCKKLVGSNTDGQAEKRNVFNWIIMACVLVSILMVILDEPSTRLTRKDTVTQETFNTIEVSLSIVFIIELGIRIIADGLLLTPNAYLRNYWNQLDICVVLLNTVTIFMGTDAAPRGLSTLRSLRILRLIRYFNGIRDIFVSLFYSFPLMLDALVFTFLVLIPFAVYGVNIFGGLMWTCNDESVLSRGECIGEFVINLSKDDDYPLNMLISRIWQNPQNNFYSYDSFQAALQHLFSLTSTEGWVDSMFSAMSTPSEPDIQPGFDWNSSTVYHGLFYITFMIISQGTIQLFVGVIIEKFKERNGITTLTTSQRQYCDLQRMLANIRPTTKVFEPKSRIRRFCYDLVIQKDGMFNKIMMFVIVLNMFTLATEFQNEPMWLSNLQDYLYVLYTVLYIVEGIIKLLGLGLKKWIRSKWNWFDFTIASVALILMCIRFAHPDLWTLRIERYCLLLVAFRLGEGIDFLETLYHTIGKSLVSTIQVSAVFMVVMCLFAMIFMEFFGLTKYGVYGTSHSNFRDYGNALLFLVRFTTGEAWNAVLIDYTVQYPNCVASSDYLQDDCGSPFWAYVLFDVFYIICAHIFMNLFTAVIINNFEYAYETRTRFTSVTKSDLRMFKHAWADLDPNGTGYIQKEDIAKLLRKLSGCFRFRIYDDVLGIDNLTRQSRTARLPSQNSSLSPRTCEEKGKPGEGSIDIGEINRCLDQMNIEETRRRRFEYNLLVKELLRAGTSKGISFDDFLTILSYRLIDISASLTLDKLIPRLEMLDQLTQEYHLEKAAGFFLSQIQKRRFIHALWKRRNEDEIQNLGVTSSSPFDLSQEDQPDNYSSNTKEKKKRIPPVPRIVINTVPTVPVDNISPITTPVSFSNPVSPMSIFSTDAQCNASVLPGLPDSLSAGVSSNSVPSSPYTDFDSNGRSYRAFSLLPHSPLPPGLSPTTIRQNWLLMDANADMPADISEDLIDSMDHSLWAGM
ncbi:calcium channel protein [Rhizopus stolonifer]|uniref:Calcium-channel protein CCH1 n=1 Tax=Rhizopus stolonifer TaxID=4846 RepID=A0A367KYL1_RHIST|nr:calcium channel protein [Rhizopus stolonifer]